MVIHMEIWRQKHLETSSAKTRSFKCTQKHSIHLYRTHVLFHYLYHIEVKKKKVVVASHLPKL